MGGTGAPGGGSTMRVFTDSPARASSELRAAGRPAAEEMEPLTPQQLEIAMLAASGLTNKEIGKRLFPSHRTVGTHLYQVFPKLGITSRADLRDALGGLSEETSEVAQRPHDR